MEKKEVFKVLDAEYIWWDGQKPVPELRNKTKILRLTEDEWYALSREDAKNDVGDPLIDYDELPSWTFDGSSTNQSAGFDSDLMLLPVYAVWDPVRGKPNILVACEVFNPDGTPHKSNTRRKLVEVSEQFFEEDALAGIEQEYNLFIQDNDGNWVPLAWGKDARQPEKQGRQYCSTGAGRAYGRKIVEQHKEWCKKAGLQIDGTNGEVMASQWEFQIGPLPPLEVADQMMLAHWLLHLAGEEPWIKVSFNPKPVKNYNGAGAHYNYSVKAMRGDDGPVAVKKACDDLKRDFEMILPYTGYRNEKRLTGAHETCVYGEFKAKERDRGASVRIPITTSLKVIKNKVVVVDNPKARRVEFRTVAANADYYQVGRCVMVSTCSAEGFRG